MLTLSKNPYIIIFYGGIGIMDIINNWIDYLLIYKGLTDSTVQQYRFNILKFFRYYCRVYNCTFSDEVILRVECTDIIQYLIFIYKKENNSASSRSNIIFSFKSLYSFLVRMNKIDNDPTSLLELPRLPERLPTYLSLEEADRLLNSLAASNKDFSERNFAIITLIINCGFRVSEISNMNLNDIRENIITVIGKRNKEREVPINYSCRMALDRYLKVRNEGLIRNPEPLFISKRGDRMSTDIIQRIVKDALFDAGLDSKKYSVHKLRHTAATFMYRYGNSDIARIKEILGHESLQTTLIYTHISTDQLQQVIDSNPLNKNYLA